MVARRPGLYTMETRSGVVQIVAIPWATANTLLTRDENRSIGIEQLNRVLAERIDEKIEEAIAHLDLTRPAILTMHGTVSNAVYSSERDIMLGKDVVVQLNSLHRPEISYVALGHIHKHQVLEDDPAVVYCGSLERIDFGEEGEPKGFVIAEFEQRNNPLPGYNHYVVYRADARFIETDATPFYTMRVQAAVDNPTEVVLRAIDKNRKKLAGAIVRVIIETSVEHAPALRDADIRRALYDAGVAHLASVSRELDRAERLRSSDRVVEELSPHEALSRFFKLRKTPLARTNKLLEYADELIGVGGATATAAGNEMGQDREGAGE
jgi:DNA repair protein SbcD/Mre11